MVRAVCLLSGGLDSATALAIALDEGFEVTALSFDYGQRHRCELEAAAAVAAAFQVRDHRLLRLDPEGFRGSALTDRSIDVPSAAERDPQAIPVTYVPARNTIFLSYALGIAEVIEAHDVFLGINAVDYSGYPDCRPEFLRAFESMAALATRAGVRGRPTRFRAPLIHWTKDEIIVRGTELGVPYHLTVSCYDPASDGGACARCEACALRRAGFLRAHVPDPTRYARTSP